MGLVIPDVSVFQGTPDWGAFSAGGYPAAIARAHSGWNVDASFAHNRDGMRAHLRVRGYYQYVVAGRDITAQATDFANAVGALQPGEVAIADIEEGSGDLWGAGQTWQQIVHARIGGYEGEYSGESFANAHLRGFAGEAGRLVWIAAYSSHEPTEGHQLWQFTDARSFPGIAGPCDASVFNGTIDQLVALVGGQPAPAPPATDTDSFFQVRT